MPKRKAINSNTVRLVEVSEIPAKNNTNCNNKTIIKDFINSDMKIVEVVNYELGYKSKRTAMTAICTLAKRMGVKAVVRQEKVYLTK